jgi:hypothetical protein
MAPEKTVAIARVLGSSDYLEIYSYIAPADVDSFFNDRGFKWTITRARFKDSCVDFQEVHGA